MPLRTCGEEGDGVSNQCPSAEGFLPPPWASHYGAHLLEQMRLVCVSVERHLHVYPRGAPEPTVPSQANMTSPLFLLSRLGTEGQ